MAEAESELTGDALKKKTVTSIFWSAVRAGWMNLSNFALFVVLARLLSPADFGIFALAALFVEISRIVASAAMGEAIMRQADLDEELADTAFWTTIGTSVLIGAIVFVAAPAYAVLITDDTVVPVIRWLACFLPISALGIVHGARLAREFRHKSLALQGAVVSLGSGIVAVVAAFAGYGVWSLVIQAAVGSALSAGLAWYAYRWVPRLRFSWAKLRPILIFNASMVSSQLIWMLIARLQDIFIARWFDATAVGTYRIAWRLIELLGQLVLGPTGGVTMITLSKLLDDLPQFGRAYNKLVAGAAILTFPLLFGFGALADVFIPLAFGEVWRPASEVVFVLVFMALPFVTDYFAPQALAAANAPRAILLSAAVQVVVTFCLTWLMVPYGLVAVALAYVIRCFLTMPLHQYMLFRAAKVSPSSTIHILRAPLISAMLMGGVVYGAKLALLPTLGEGWTLVFVGILIGVVTNLAIMLVIGRSLLTSFSMVGKLLARTGV